MKVKTKDWGPKYEGLKDHVGRMATAVKAHNDALADEVAKVQAGGGQHAFARHGWQTGWQAQVVRVVAGKTPEQAFDPYGVHPSIRTWGRVFVAGPGGLQQSRYGLNSSGQRVVEGLHTTFTPTDDTVAPTRGASAGHFISPMAQQAAMQQAKAKVLTYGRWTEAERKKGPNKSWCPVRRMVITTRGPGGVLGLGFSLASGSAPRSEAEARALIEAFEQRATVKEVMSGCPFSSGDTRTATRAALEGIHNASYQALQSGNPVAFPQITDLFTALGVEVEANRWVLSVWDRDTTANAWKLVTAYAMGAGAEEAEMVVVGAKKSHGALTGKARNGTGGTKNGVVKQGKLFLT